MDVVTPYHSRVHPDIIDRLDDVSGLQYHHEGPYDAACAGKNQSGQSSPVAALSHSNTEILKATPPYKIDDCLHCHRPLDGVAFYPPGVTDLEGNTYDYSEGSNMHMTDRDMSRNEVHGCRLCQRSLLLGGSCRAVTGHREPAQSHAESRRIKKSPRNVHFVGASLKKKKKGLGWIQS